MRARWPRTGRARAWTRAGSCWATGTRCCGTASTSCGSPSWWAPSSPGSPATPTRWLPYGRVGDRARSAPARPPRPSTSASCSRAACRVRRGVRALRPLRLVRLGRALHDPDARRARDLHRARARGRGPRPARRHRAPPPRGDLRHHVRARRGDRGGLGAGEWASDHRLGSRLQLSNDDTVGDLLADTLGAATGAALLVVWAVRGWGSVRRIPGENRYEATEAPGSAQFCAPPTPRRRSWKSGGFSTIWLKRTTVTVSSTETSRP